jgi:hypothetical protein
MFNYSTTNWVHLFLSFSLLYNNEKNLSKHIRGCIFLCKKDTLFVITCVKFIGT